MTIIDAKTANEIYDLLIRKVGALERHREDFVANVTFACREFRFGGSLGFGGKFYNDHRWRINCYPEDATTERTRLITEVNSLLELMRTFPPQVPS